MPAFAQPAGLSMQSGVLAGHNRSVHASALDFDFHFHDRCELLFFLGGKGEMLVEQTRYPLTPGSLLVFNANEVHRVFPGPDLPYERITIHFDPALIQGLPLGECDLLSCFRDRPAGTGNATLLAGQPFREYHRLADELVALLKGADPAREAGALARLVELLAIANRGFRSAAPAPPAFTGFVAEAIAWMEGHLAEEFTIAALARHHSVSPFHFSHAFKRQTGASPYHYILVKRIALAKQLLSEGHSCTQACEQAGFGDYNNFSRTFKKYVGAIPSAYRRAHR